MMPVTALYYEIPASDDTFLVTDAETWRSLDPLAETKRRPSLTEVIRSFYKNDLIIPNDVSEMGEDSEPLDPLQLVRSLLIRKKGHLVMW